MFQLLLSCLPLSYLYCNRKSKDMVYFMGLRVFCFFLSMMNHDDIVLQNFWILDAKMYLPMNNHSNTQNSLQGRFSPTVKVLCDSCILELSEETLESMVIFRSWAKVDLGSNSSFNSFIKYRVCCLFG